MSLIELMIAVAIVGILSALVVPTYQSYIDTSNMSKVNTAYQSAIRTGQSMFAKAKTNSALGLPSGLPTGKNNRKASDAWIEIFNKGGIQAPGGGPAYVNNSVKQAAANELGAVRVIYNRKKQQLTIWRPKYLELTRYRARMTISSLKTKEFAN